MTGLSRDSLAPHVVVALISALALAAATGCGDSPGASGPTDALVVVSPHPDDESIFGGATIHRLAADQASFVHAVYVSGGDKATVPGDCNGIPEARKAELIVELREGETRAAWRVLAPGRDVPIDFVRGPDQGLVASSTVVEGVRRDTLTPAGEAALERAAELAREIPASVRSVLFLTTSIYDAHPDHRTAYHAARQAAEALRERGLDVRLWSWIVHDEVAQLDLSACCAGDIHWPAPGARNNFLALTDTAGRPRPPLWSRVEDASDSTSRDVRQNALAEHVSQVVGWPPLCMPVYIPSFYARWNEKIEEPFYEERP